MDNLIDSLLQFAKISEITYSNPPEAEKKFKSIDVDIIKFFNIQGAQSYLLKHNEQYVLSFRGTELKEASDLLADLEAGKNFEISNNGIALGKVHHGFKKELDKLWPEIKKHTEGINSLHITGHSLGAAMATIAASRLQTKVISLVTFGSPRVGTKEFVKNCTFLHYRVQNNCDDVTKVPFMLMGYKHHGNHIYLNLNGEIKNYNLSQVIKDMIRSRIINRFKKQRFTGLTDHYMKNYIDKLSKNLK